MVVFSKGILQSPLIWLFPDIAFSASFSKSHELSGFHPLLGEGTGDPLQYSCLENPMDGGAWWAAVHGVAKSRKRMSDFTFTFHFHALEKEMATHSSVLAWRIPGTGEHGGLPSMGSHRVGHDWCDLAAAAAAFTSGHSLLVHVVQLHGPYVHFSNRPTHHWAFTHPGLGGFPPSWPS